MKKKSKGQVSIESLFVILLIILFLYVFSGLADKAVRSLEVAKIKEQELEIAQTIDSFLQQQNYIVNQGLNLIDYSVTMQIPNINIASRKPSCVVSIDAGGISVTVPDYNGITTILAKAYDPNLYDVTTNISCGQVLTCNDNGSGKLHCYN